MPGPDGSGSCNGTRHSLLRLLAGDEANMLWLGGGSVVYGGWILAVGVFGCDGVVTRSCATSLVLWLALGEVPFHWDGDFILRGWLSGFGVRISKGIGFPFPRGKVATKTSPSCPLNIFRAPEHGHRMPRSDIFAGIEAVGRAWGIVSYWRSGCADPQLVQAEAW